MILLRVCPAVPVRAGSAPIVLKFLKRNRADLFKNPVVLTRWGLFFKGYKEDRYYWELVITLRKVCVVALSVFGRELGGRGNLRLLFAAAGVHHSGNCRTAFQGSDGFSQDLKAAGNCGPAGGIR